MMARITIQTIAERAGVSRGTVDRVLHGRPSVNPEIRKRVQDVARQLRYTEQLCKDKTPKRLGVVLPGNGWFNTELKQEWMRGVQDAKAIIEPLGFQVEVIECETDLPHECMERVQAMRARGLDGLAVSAKNSPFIRQMIDSLAQADVPVITFNSDIPDSRRDCFVGQNLYQSGRVAADLISKYIGAQDEILVVAGNLEFDAHKQRVHGFAEKCAEKNIAASRLHVVESFNEYVLTYEKVRAALAERPRLRAVYMANESVPACAEAVKRSERRDKIMVVGNDLSAATRQLLAEGMVDFILEQNVYWQGYQPIVLLKNRILTGVRTEEALLFTNISVMNAENTK